MSAWPPCCSRAGHLPCSPGEILLEKGDLRLILVALCSCRRLDGFVHQLAAFLTSPLISSLGPPWTRGPGWWGSSSWLVSTQGPWRRPSVQYTGQQGILAMKSCRPSSPTLEERLGLLGFLLSIRSCAIRIRTLRRCLHSRAFRAAPCAIDVALGGGTRWPPGGTAPAVPMPHAYLFSWPA
jgi:hypothetical protein